MSHICQFFIILLFFAPPLIATESSDIVPIDRGVDQIAPIQQHPALESDQIPGATYSFSPTPPNSLPQDEVQINIRNISPTAQIRADLSERWWYERWAYHYLNCTACLCVQFGGLIETLSVVFTFVGIIITGVLGISALDESVRSPLIVISTTLTSFCVVAPRLTTAFFKLSTQRENLADDYARYGRADPRNLEPITMVPEQNPVVSSPEGRVSM